MTPHPRAHLAELAPVHHGGVSDAELAELGLRRDEVIDFSTSTNPLGPSPAAVAAARAAVWTHYPDDRAAALRRALATAAGVAEDEVVVANGSAELIWLLALAFLDPGEAAVVVGPTFGEYARAVRIVGGVVQEYRARPEEGFAVDVAAVAERARTVTARLVFLCNPNNPTGVLLPSPAVAALARAARDTLIVVDEAYMPFVDEPPPGHPSATSVALGTPPPAPLLALGNVVLLRSLTKDCAMPGLRLGYALAPAPVADALDRVRPAWSVNAVAQAAGLAAIGDAAHLARARDEVRRAHAYLTRALGALGLSVLPSAANFVLVEVGDAAATRAALLRHRVVVRDCTSFGLPRHVRIGLRTVPECERLVAAFAAYRAGVRP
jgi:histidinol-phosphate aminotransferase